jgi:ABC-type multidrug transport system ATPase subunit
MNNSPVIRCHNLCHSYAGKAVLRQVNFELATGEPIGLVGPNGAGKTTLLSILCGFIYPTAGSVSLFGHKPGASALNGKVSALPQDAKLDPSFTIGDQLSFYARLQGLNRQQALREATRVLGAVALKDSSFNGRIIFDNKFIFLWVRNQ